MEPCASHVRHWHDQPLNAATHLNAVSVCPVELARGPATPCQLCVFLEANSEAAGDVVVYTCLPPQRTSGNRCKLVWVKLGTALPVTRWSRSSERALGTTGGETLGAACEVAALAYATGRRAAIDSRC